MVDTGRRGRTTVYRIMQPGEVYLEAGGSQAREGEDGKGRSPRRPRRQSRRRQPADGGGARSASGGKTSPASRATRGSGRRGPKALLEELIDEGFFSEPRTMAETQEQTQT